MVTGSSSTSSCAEAFYPSQWDALSALSSVSVRGTGHGRPYPTGACRCATCRGWHLTTESPVEPLLGEPSIRAIAPH